MTIKRYFFRLFVSLDQLANTILGGYPDETMSSRMGKKLAQKRNCPICTVICRWLNYIDPEHCAESIEYDEGRERENERLKRQSR